MAEERRNGNPPQDLIGPLSKTCLLASRKICVTHLCPALVDSLPRYRLANPISGAKSGEFILVFVSAGKSQTKASDIFPVCFRREMGRRPRSCWLLLTLAETDEFHGFILLTDLLFGHKPLAQYDT